MFKQFSADYWKLILFSMFETIAFLSTFHLISSALPLSISFSSEDLIITLSVASIILPFFIAPLVDIAGFKKALVASAVFALLSRSMLLFYSMNIFTTLMFGLLHTFSSAIVATALNIGIKRVTTKSTLAVGYAFLATTTSAGGGSRTYFE